MKKIFAFLLFALPLMAATSCGNTAVKNPPTFVEMYLQEEESSLMSQARNRSSPLKAEGDYDEIIYSHSDFYIAVITSGVNYDLLYSVELSDSLLGTCIYTNQSLTYKADATIIVEPDNTYTTEIILTIPGSTEHDTYLSERTITLSKILFSRDTVDGTFPADIPSNTETVLDFQVRAVNYMDAELGFPVVMNDGFIDIDIRPETPNFTLAQAAAKTTLAIPATINDFPIRSIFLQSLDWVEHLLIQGASEDVILIGSFTSLLTLSFTGLDHDLEMTNPTYAELALTGLFPNLTTLSINGSNGYNLFMGENYNSVNEDYQAYCEAALSAPYSFPSLTSISITSASMNELDIGNDNHVRSFDALETFTIDQSIIGSLYFGNENKSFNSLVSITGIDSFVTGFVVSGTKDLANIPATLTLDEGDYGYLLVNDNAIGVFDFGAISLSGITLDSTGTHPIRLAHLDLANIAFEEGNGDRRIRLQGDFPYLETISLTNMAVGEMYIGNPLSEFDALTSITFDSFTAYSIRIGERDVSFDVLASITFNDVEVANTISIGYENSSYPLLEMISVSQTTTNVFALGRMNDSFDALKIFSFEDVTIVTELMVQGAIAPVLEVMLLHRVTLPVMNIMFASADYDMYVETLTINNDFYISNTCATIYVTNDPASSWAYYARATELGIPVVTGTYSPV